MDRFERLPDMACEVTPELKQRIRDVNREAHALHLAVFPTVYVGAKVTDFEGNVLENKEYKANSYNRNYWNAVAYLLTGTFSSESSYGEGKINIKAASGTLIAFNSSSHIYVYPISATANFVFSFANSTNGLVVGTSNATESFDSYALGAEIADGTASGQMLRLSPVMSTTPSYNSTSKIYSSTLCRSFKNTSGGTISVNESGIRCTTNYSELMERTVFPSAIAVPNGSQIEITYTFEFVYPEPA